MSGTPEDLAVQRAARNMVMEIPLFPDLTIRLRRALGYGPHVDMLQHFCYWLNPNKPKMRDRWTLYKTYREWHDECGLTDRQVKKGRKILRDLGLVTEEKGPYGRIHYRVNWLALTTALSLDGISDQTDELEDLLGGPDEGVSLDGISVRGQFGRQDYQSSLDGISEQPNTGENAGDYLQDSSLLQSGAEPAPAPENKNKEPQEDFSPALPTTDKRHSQAGEPPKPKLSKEVEHKVWAQIFDFPNETAITRLADLCITARPNAGGDIPTAEQVAERAREQLGGREPLEAYTRYVRRCLEDKRADPAREEIAS